MKDIKTAARILAALTEEQWEAILTVGPNLASHVSEEVFLRENKSHEKEDSLNVRVQGILKKIGIPSHILGYTYLEETVVMLYEYESRILPGVTKVIYPQIAKKFNSTPNRVERAIRTAIETAFEHGDSIVHDEIFKGSYSYLKGKPTNSQFISTLVEYVKVYG